MARARFGRRRMKPRSSSAVMRRWMIERVLHLVEGRRYARFLETLMDKPQQFGLLAR
jgi:hypothetical protein